MSKAPIIPIKEPPADPVLEVRIDPSVYVTDAVANLKMVCLAWPKTAIKTDMLPASPPSGAYYQSEAGICDFVTATEDPFDMPFSIGIGVGVGATLIGVFCIVLLIGFVKVIARTARHGRTMRMG